MRHVDGAENFGGKVEQNERAAPFCLCLNQRERFNIYNCKYVHCVLQ